MEKFAFDCNPMIKLDTAVSQQVSHLARYTEIYQWKFTVKSKTAVGSILNPSNRKKIDLIIEKLKITKKKNPGLILTHILKIER